jgi:hypothetical protein
MFTAFLLAISFSASADDAVKSPPSIQNQTDEGQSTIEHETGFYYTVQKGDTLWDLSRKFSNSAWQWPELWKENSQIANPHRIYPGERIRLYRRTGTYRSGETTEKSALSKKTPSPESINFYYVSMDQVGFIRKVPVAAHGTIYQAREARDMIYRGDVVYIRPEGNFALAVGNRYTVYRTLKPIVDAKTDTYIGVQHFLTGVVEIIQQEPRYAIGRIIESYRAIRVGDMLMPYNRRLPRITLQKSQEGIQGQIIEGEENQTIIGDSVIAFIDKGQQDGIKPGQFYSIYYKDMHRIKTKSDQEELFTPVDFGELLVLHTESTTATVLITRIEKEVVPGTLIHTPQQ